MANVQDCYIVECEFELQSGYDVHFRISTLEKVMKNVAQPTKGLTI